jgi:multisubunit Na+/H+ antiporter MnhG subunit
VNKENKVSIAFFLVLVGATSYVIAKSAYKLFPDVWEMSLGAIAITAALIGLMHYLTHNKSESLRQWAIIFTVAATIGHGADFLGHISYSREYSAAKRNDLARDDAKQKDIGLAKQKADIEISMMDADARRAAAVGKLLWLTPQKMKTAVTQQFLKPGEPIAKASPSPTPTSAQATSDELVAETAEQVSVKWQARLFNILLLVTGITFLGSVALMGLMNWDGNRNGVADWVENKAATMAESDFAAAFPVEYKAHRSKLVFAPGGFL